MKHLIIVFVFTGSIIKISAQDTALSNLKNIKKSLEIIVPKINKSNYRNSADLVLNDPGVYNELWGKVYNSLRDTNSLIFKNLKIEFKTFQGSDSNKTSIGLFYKWDYDFNQNKGDFKRTGIISKITASGNIATKKNLNPQDFQQGKIILGKYGFWGGTVTKLDSGKVAKLNSIKSKLTEIDDKKELATSPLWNEVTAVMNIKNHFHYEFSATCGWEGSQDFSKTQFSYGVQMRFSAKSYSNNNSLAQLNLLDYPFALIRYLTGTDETVTPYGSTLPVLTFGIEKIKPTQDSVRKAVVGNEADFTRIRFETGFRTILINTNELKLHFNAAYRYYKELNAPALIKASNLHKFSYLTFSITGTEGYFVSYSYGKLPFDKSDNAIYEVGFKTNF